MGYMVQIDVTNHVLFVSILDPPKKRLCQNLVFYHVCSPISPVSMEGGVQKYFSAFQLSDQNKTCSEC